MRRNAIDHDHDDKSRSDEEFDVRAVSSLHFGVGLPDRRPTPEFAALPQQGNFFHRLHQLLRMRFFDDAIDVQIPVSHPFFLIHEG